MAKYLFKVNYSVQGLEGLLKDGGSARREAAEKLMQSVGGTVESVYFAFGDADVYVTADLPDAPAAASAALRVGAAGGATVQTTVLLTAEQIDAAVKATVDYEPPGTYSLGLPPPELDDG